MCFNRIKNARDTALQLMEDGLVSEKAMAEMCISWMSPDSVAEMLRANDVLLDSEED